MKNIKKKLIIFFIILVAILPLKSLWSPKFYTSHDGQSHLARLYEFNRILKEGQFPPRWAGQFSGERGYPVFIFAYPLPYFAGELFYLSGFNLAESLKLTFAVFFVLSGLAMLFLVKEVFKNDWAALLAAFLYTWAPYRFVKIYVTASLGESMAFIWPPLIFLFIYKYFFKKENKYLIYYSLCLSGLILTHLITLVMFLPLISFFILWCLVKNKDYYKKIKKFFLATFLGIGLSGFYLFPAIYEIRFTHYKEIITKNYYLQFVEPIKLIYSAWGYGVPKLTPDGLSLQVGIAQWLVVGLAGINILYFLVKFRKRESKIFWLSEIFLLNFFLAIFFMLAISKPLWDLLPPLQSVDTPWRFLSLAVFCSSFLGGFVVLGITKIKFKYSLMLAVGCWLLAAGLAFYGNRNHLRINDSVDWDENYFKNYYWVGSGWNEYVPKWARKKPYQLPPNEVVETSCQVTDLKTNSRLVSFTINCDKLSTVVINRYYYPGWVLTENKTKKNFFPNKDGLLTFKTEKGNFQIDFEFKETITRLLADTISLISFVFIGYLFYKKR